jgi:hypothetical protein
MIRATGAAADFLRTRFDLDLGIDAEAVWVGSRRARVYASPTETELGVILRPVEETVADQVAWMKASNRF